MDPSARTIIRHVESLGYCVNRMTFLRESGKLHRFTVWPRANTPDGLYRGGETFRAEAEDQYVAACRLAEMVGVELDDG